MTGRTHGAWGMLTGAGTAYVALAVPVPGVGWPLHLVGILLAGLGSLVPDLDTEESFLLALPAQEGKRSRSIILAVLGGLIGLVLRLVSWIVRLFTKHREATHSLLAVVIGALVVGLLGGTGGATITALQAKKDAGAAFLHAVTVPEVRWQALYLMLVFAIGWGSHLFLDLLTERGCPLGYPISKKRVRLLRLRTGGPADNFLRMLGNVLTGLVLLLYAVGLLQQLGWLKPGWWPL